MGGFVEMYGNKRTIGFSNCERYFAKGTRGINGVKAIPELRPDSPNDFLTRLFAEYNTVSAEEAAQTEALQKAYAAAMAEGQAIIDEIIGDVTANVAIEKIRGIKHALTSLSEIRAAFAARVAECGLVFDKSKGCYVFAEPSAEAQEDK